MGSLERSTQPAFPHSVCPTAAQTHLPALQVSLAPQAWPQEPQLLTSVTVLTQPMAPPQSRGVAAGHWQETGVLGGEPGVTAQVASGPQLFWQVPQCFGSVCRFTQVFPHWSGVATFLLQAWQVPETHVAPMMQALPQAPQLSGSIVSSTQVALG